MKEENGNTITKVPVPIGPRGLAPADLDGLWRCAQMVAQSGMAPKGMSANEIVVAAAMGFEMGLPFFAAIQNIAVINGRPSAWGDVVLGLVRASGELADIDEIFEGERGTPQYRAVCSVLRVGKQRPIVRTFSVQDAKTAGLWEKKGRDGQPTPWITYPYRMLQMRARSWALRDGFGDILRGIWCREEAQDIPPDQAILPPRVAELPDRSTVASLPTVSIEILEPAPPLAAVPAAPAPKKRQPKATLMPAPEQAPQPKVDPLQEPLYSLGDELACSSGSGVVTSIVFEVRGVRGVWYELEGVKELAPESDCRALALAGVAERIAEAGIASQEDMFDD